jgi:hypothetical protein
MRPSSPPNNRKGCTLYAVRTIPANTTDVRIWTDLRGRIVRDITSKVHSAAPLSPMEITDAPAFCSLPKRQRRQRATVFGLLNASESSGTKQLD